MDASGSWTVPSGLPQVLTPRARVPLRHQRCARMYSELLGRFASEGPALDAASGRA